jgi:vesicle-associated membrane protein 72
MLAQVDEVKSIMSDNIDKVLARGEKLDTLVDKTDSLMTEVRCGTATM